MKSLKRKCESNENDKDCKLISRYDDVIYFYESVTTESIFKLINEIKKANDFLNSKRRLDKSITLHICSDGGCVYSGLAAMDTIASNIIPITTIMEGNVASAATFLALGGHDVRIRPNCDVLIHQISSEFWGKYEDFKDQKESLDKLMKKLRIMYETKTKIPKTILDKMFQRDITICAQDCVKWKIASLYN